MRRPRGFRSHQMLVGMRFRLTQTLPAKAWEETPAAFGVRLLQCCAHVKAELYVGALCKEFPQRIRQLVEAEGDRLKK